MYEPEDYEIIEPQQRIDVHIGVVIDDDVNDSGTAPLQNTEIPVDTSEGVTNMYDSTTAQTEKYFMAVDAVYTVVNQFHQRSQK